METKKEKKIEELQESLGLIKMSFYLGLYDDEDNSGQQWLPFAYKEWATQDELQKHFRKVVYKSEYGFPLKKTDKYVEVIEFEDVYHYGKRKYYKINLKTKQ